MCQLLLGQLFLKPSPWLLEGIPECYQCFSDSSPLLWAPAWHLEKVVKMIVGFFSFRRFIIYLSPFHTALSHFGVAVVSIAFPFVQVSWKLLELSSNSEPITVTHKAAFPLLSSAVLLTFAANGDRTTEGLNQLSSIFPEFKIQEGYQIPLCAALMIILFHSI